MWDRELNGALWLKSQNLLAKVVRKLRVGASDDRFFKIMESNPLQVGGPARVGLLA